MKVNKFYMATDSNKAISKLNRINQDKAKANKVSASVITLEVLDLIKQGKVREANAIINASKGDK